MSGRPKTLLTLQFYKIAVDDILDSLKTMGFRDVHLFYPIDSSQHQMASVPEIKKETEKYLKNTTAALKSKGFNASFRVVYGEPVILAINEALKVKATEIGVIIHEYNEKDGSYLKSIMEKSQIPVLITQINKNEPEKTKKINLPKFFENKIKKFNDFIDNFENIY